MFEVASKKSFSVFCCQMEVEAPWRWTGSHTRDQLGQIAEGSGSSERKGKKRVDSKTKQEMGLWAPSAFWFLTSNISASLCGKMLFLKSYILCFSYKNVCVSVCVTHIHSNFFPYNLSLLVHFNSVYNAEIQRRPLGGGGSCLLPQKSLPCLASHFEEVS